MSLRSALLAGFAALLPGTAGPALARTSVAPAAFSPPVEPLVLTRTLWRSLHDGNEIRVERRYTVRIHARDEGYVVDGELIDSRVDAPPPLGALARIEQQRGEPGLFPMVLDQAGRIVSPPSAAEPTARAAAITQGQNLLANAPIPAPDRAQAQALLAPVMAAAGTGSAWPTDLFNPAAETRSERRSLALPGGKQGEIDVTIAVAGRHPGTLPRSVERTVVTTLDGTRRVSREVWTLAPG